MSEETVTVVAGSGDLLIGALPIEPDRVTSRRILKASGARIVRLSIDAGQVLKEHTAAVPILVQVLSGRARVDADGSSLDLPAGAIVHIEARVPHSVEALTQTHLLLTLLDGYDTIRLGHGDGHKRERPRSAANMPDPAQAPTQSDPVTPSATNTLVLASSGADSAALDAITRRHAELSGSLAASCAHLLDVAASTSLAALMDARHHLSQWCHDILIPQLASEAGMLYPAADDVPTGSALVTRLRADIDHIGELLERVETQDEATALATATVALRVAVARHLTTESERLLPLLAASREHSLAALWRDVESTSSSRAGGRGRTDDEQEQAAVAAR
jgi:quercetin dioxygenase-like cupin family protein